MIAVCKKDLSVAAVKDVFAPTYDCMRRYEGTWHIERRLLFPSFVFLESENKKLLSEELPKVAALIKEKECLFSIGREEEDFLKNLCDETHHLKISRGIICKGSTHIMEGPLKGLESRICRIDRHKRLVKLAVPQSISYITAGLEITKKSM